MPDFLLRLTAPIAGESPFGADVNHDPDYECLKGEIGKLGDIDVDVVEALSLKILTEKSKDIRALAWLAYAVLRKGDLGRLADVLCVLVDYCADSFDLIFPRREGAKLAALRWLSEPRFTSRCPKVDAGESDAPHIERLKDALTRLKPVLEARFPSTGAPFPSLLYKRVMEWEKMAAPVQNSVGGDGVDVVVGDADQPANQPVNKPVINKSGGMPPAASDNENNHLATVVIKLSHSEYRELVDCVGRVETLLKKFA